MGEALQSRLVRRLLLLPLRPGAVPKAPDPQ